MQQLIQILENRFSYIGRWAFLLALGYCILCLMGMASSIACVYLVAGDVVWAECIAVVLYLATSWLLAKRVTNTAEGGLVVLILSAWWWVILPWMFVEWIVKKRKVNKN